MQESARSTDADDGQLRVFFQQSHCRETRRAAREAVEHGCDTSAEERGEEDAQREHECCVAHRENAERDQCDDGGEPKLCARDGQRQWEEALEYKEDEGECGEQRNARHAVKVHIISLR